MCVTAVLAGLGGLAASKVLAPAKPKAQAMTDPAAERLAAETTATQAANSKLAAKNRSRAASSLLASGGINTALGVTGGKTTLGQ